VNLQARFGLGDVRTYRTGRQCLRRRAIGAVFFAVEAGTRQGGAVHFCFTVALAIVTSAAFLSWMRAASA